MSTTYIDTVLLRLALSLSSKCSMDPLSPLRLAEVVEDLAWFTKMITANLLRYAGENVAENSNELVREMQIVCDLLESLNRPLTVSEHYGSSPATLDSLKRSIDQFGKILREMESVVDQRGTGRSSWPFSKEENQYFLTQIQLSKETFAMAPNINWPY